MIFGGNAVDDAKRVLLKYRLHFKEEESDYTFFVLFRQESCYNISRYYRLCMEVSIEFRNSHYEVTDQAVLPGFFMLKTCVQKKEHP